MFHTLGILLCLFLSVMSMSKTAQISIVMVAAIGLCLPLLRLPGLARLWGVFAMVLGGAVAGAAVGALSKSLEGTGITKKDLETIRTEVTEGTSALFLVTEAGDLDQLGDRLRGMNKTLVSTNLTDAERAVLVETFGG